MGTGLAHPLHALTIIHAFNFFILFLTNPTWAGSSLMERYLYYYVDRVQSMGTGPALSSQALTIIHASTWPKLLLFYQTLWIQLAKFYGFVLCSWPFTYKMYVKKTTSLVCLLTKTPVWEVLFCVILKNIMFLYGKRTSMSPSLLDMTLFTKLSPTVALC